MASSRTRTDARDELTQGLPATGSAPIGGTGDLDRPLGDNLSEKVSGAPARSEPLADGARASRRNAAGWRLLLVGGVLFALGLIAVLIDAGFSEGLGVILMAFATVPTLAGIGMLLFSGVERRSARGGPFA